jgi:BolA-like protein 1
MKGLDAKETHFRIEIVSDIFEGKTLIQRHRLVQDLLKDEFSSGLHALSLKLKTTKEFSK